MSRPPKGGSDSSHRSEILRRFSDSEVVTRKWNDHMVWGAEKKQSEEN